MNYKGLNKIEVWKLEFTQANCGATYQNGLSIYDERDNWLRKHHEQEHHAEQQLGESSSPAGVSSATSLTSLEQEFDTEFKGLSVIARLEIEGKRIRFFSLDNRRLWLLRACAPHGKVSITWSADERDFLGKYYKDRHERDQLGLHPHEIVVRDPRPSKTKMEKRQAAHHEGGHKAKRRRHS